MNSKKKGYTRLSPIGEELSLDLESEKGEQQIGDRCLTRSILYILAGTLAATVCILLGYLIANIVATKSAVAPSTQTTILQCGNTSTEARDLGCVFDLLTNNWMPEYCSDPQTDAEYREWVMGAGRELGPWAFFLDKRAEQQVGSERELSDLVGQHIYTTTENHLAHCIFLARRMHRLVTGDIAAVAHNTLKHTMHCTSAVLKSLETEAESQDGAAVSMSTFDVSIVPCKV